MAGIEMIHIPYRGAGPALNDLLPGRVDVMFNNIGAVLPLIRAGKLRALAVTTAKRTSAAPELPPIAESGVSRRSSGKRTPIRSALSPIL